MAKVISSIHFTPRTGGFLPLKQGISDAWRGICRSDLLRPDGSSRIGNHIKGVWGDGSSIRFWWDSWISDLPLSLLYPNLYKLERNKNCLVMDRVMGAGPSRQVSWAWSRRPISVVESQQLIDISSLISNANPTGSCDSWLWKGNSSGCFSIMSVKRLVTADVAIPLQRPFARNILIPLKVDIFAWRAALDRLPTRMTLQKWGVAVQSSLCPVCAENDESILHLLTACHSASVVWQVISAWLKLPPIYALEVDDLIDFHVMGRVSERKKQIIQAIMIIGCWAIWKQRNNILFNGTLPKPANIVQQIKSQGFLWISSPAKSFSFSWKEWCSFDLL